MQENHSEAPTIDMALPLPKPIPFTSYQRFVIILLAVLQFTIILDFMIISPLGDLMMKSLDMSTARFGSVVSAYAISAGISGFLTAGFADEFDRKKLLLFFYIGFVVGTVFCGLATTYHSLFIARIVTGVFGGVVGSISMAIITDLFSLQQRGRVLGFVQMAFAGSQILGVPIGLLLASSWGWHSTFFMVAGLAFVIGIAVVMKLKPIAAHLKIKRDKNPLQHLLRTSEFSLPIVKSSVASAHFATHFFNSYSIFRLALGKDNLMLGKF